LNDVLEKIYLILNGEPKTVETDPRRTLLDVLREDLDLTGTKRACDDEGQCGACTVILDGRAVRACRTLVGKVSGRRVTTIEGIGAPARLHPLQRAFVENGAVQCGFCTPGLIVSAKALLDRNPHPSREQVVRALSGNLCRCTGYVRVIDAVMSASAVLRGQPSHGFDLPAGVIGGDPLRADAVDKVTGRTRFAGDIKLPGMLVAVVLRSPHAHARIVDVDTSTALQVAGVNAVYTAADIPGVRAFTDRWGARDALTDAHPSLAYEPILADERVRMVGEPVAMLVATSVEAAQAGLARVRVTYEPLEPIQDPELALRPGGDRLHESGNLYEYGEIKVGRFEAAQADTEVQVEVTYSVPSRDHVTIETSSALACWDEKGKLVVVGPTHQPHPRQQQIAATLDISPEQVRVIAPPLGGSFGSRHHFWPVVACALPAYLLRQPVRLIYTRREEFEATLKDHPFRLTCRLGAREDGRLTGLWARATGDAGPYGGAPSIAPFVALSGSGPYTWSAVDYEVRVAHTNGANAGPLRGYGMPHGVLGLECGLDELASALKIDPWELRMRNAADRTTGTCTGQPFDEPFGFKPVLQAIKPDWDRAREGLLRPPTAAEADEKRGAGLATSWYQFGKSGDLRVSVEAELDLEGRVVLYYCAMNSGQGLDTVMSQLAADELNLPRERILLVNNDTERTLDSHVYGASKTTYWVGGAVVAASRKLKAAMLHVASGVLRVAASELRIVDGAVCWREDPGRAVSLKDVAAAFHRRRLPRRYTGVFDLEARYPKQGRPRYLGHFSVGAALAEVSVNVTTGKVNVTRLVVAQDVGKAVNPIDVRGQIEGAAMMDLGAALLEEHVPGHTLDFKRYRLPRTRDLPQLKVIVVEVPGVDGPHGVKGVGEAAAGHVRAAILNAIYDAIGVRVRRLPATPERVLEALRGRAHSQEGAIGNNEAW